jgi:uncharacterized membrane protein YfcA
MGAGNPRQTQARLSPARFTLKSVGCTEACFQTGGPMIFSIVVLLVSVLAGGVAAISGFGIGSLMTPLLSLRYGTKLAVAIISVPHIIATAARFLRLRQHLDRRVFLNFGILSAIGGLLGALVNSRANSPALTIVFGCLLLLAGISGLTGLLERLHLGRRAAWIAGALSGFFGGLVGNQGGIRSAALLSFGMSKEAMVATATAVGLIVDGARMPVYFAVEHGGILQAWAILLVAIAGVLLGTFWGVKLLRKIPQQLFPKLLSCLILALGVYMVVHGIRQHG